MTQHDAAFHDSFKPRWGPMDTLICAKSGMMNDPKPNTCRRWEKGISVTSEGRDIALLKFTQKLEVRPVLLTVTRMFTDMDSLPT